MVFKSLFYFLAVLSCSLISAQESLPFYDHYLLTDSYLINPSHAGEKEDILKVRATHYSQWAGIEDAPNTQTISAHTRVTNRLAFGGYAYLDENGASSLSGFNLTAAYHIPFGEQYANAYDETNQFSFGLSYHVYNQSFDRTKWNIQHPNDPLLQETSFTNNFFNIGGSFIYDNFYGGVSMQDVSLGNNKFIVNAIEPLPTNYYFTLGYKYNISDAIQLKPSALMRLNSNSEREFNVTLESKFTMGYNAFNLGLNYRTATDKNGSQALSITPLINLEMGRLRLGYAYRLGLTDIAQEAGDAHLISLGYNFTNPFSFR